VLTVSIIRVITDYGNNKHLLKRRSGSPNLDKAVQLRAMKTLGREEV
jgi:hypothetical protein